MSGEVAAVVHLDLTLSGCNAVVADDLGLRRVEHRQPFGVVGLDQLVEAIDDRRRVVHRRNVSLARQRVKRRNAHTHQSMCPLARPLTVTSTRHSTTCSIAPSTSPLRPPILRIANTATATVPTTVAATSGAIHQPVTASTIASATMMPAVVASGRRRRA